VAEAAKTSHNRRSFYKKEHQAVVENDKIKEYRITGKLNL
jgi:hypothetical protein